MVQLQTRSNNLAKVLFIDYKVCSLYMEEKLTVSIFLRVILPVAAKARL